MPGVPTVLDANRQASCVNVRRNFLPVLRCYIFIYNHLQLCRTTLKFSKFSNYDYAIQFYVQKTMLIGSETLQQ